MSFRAVGRLGATFCLAVATVVFAIPAAGAATTIHVPADQPTIQAGIDAAVAGDTVMVAPGTYFENIDFQGKDITVRSSDGAAATIIDGQDLAPVVIFANSETPAAVLRGFTIQNGHDIEPTNQGGGIWVYESSPTIRKNVIRSNTAQTGAGIYVRIGAPLIEDNTIKKNKGCMANGIELRSSNATVRNNVVKDNFRASCNSTADGGGGIRIANGGSPLIEGNVISGNRNSWGAGISSYNIGSARIIGNLIINNEGYELGGGINASSGGDPVIMNNIVAGNTTNRDAAGIYVDVSFASALVLVNNTLFGNVSSFDRMNGIQGDDWGTNSVIANNIIHAGDGNGIECLEPPPNAINNNFFSSDPHVIGTDCSDLLAGDVNLSVDPAMLAPELGNFGLFPASPMVDAGDDASAPAYDFFGAIRPIDGDEDGQAHVDIGAVELAVPYISGTVTAGGLAADRVCVRAHTSATDIAAEAMTNGSGQFFIAPPVGVYRIAFDDCTRGLFAPEWFDNAAAYATATDVDLTSGSVGGVDASLDFADFCNGLAPTMWGGPEDDTITGTAGADVIMGGAGNDTIDGGGGKDTICGEAGDDTLIGGTGTDVLIGNSGADVLDGGKGDDELRGGSGVDEVTYLAAPGGVNVNLVTGLASGAFGNDVLSSIKHVHGSLYHDTIIAGAGKNKLYGEKGNDIIEGGAGADILRGGDGDDLIDGGSGPDDISGASGDDRLWGKGGNDELAGGFDEDILQGGSGNDILRGGTDSDLMLGGPGDDLLQGGGGTRDTASYQYADGPVVVDLGAQTGTGEGNDTFSSVEGAVGSKFDDTMIGSDEDDSMYGFGGKDTISGGPGADILEGGGGTDILRGQGGRDLLLGGTGDDILDGGVGADAASWQFSATPVVANLTTGSATGEGTDTFISIEDLVGSAFNDTLIGNNGENFLLGLGGADSLYGRSWRDALFGGRGNDKLYGEIGDDYLDGEQDTDALNGGTGNDACIDGESHVSCEVIQDISADNYELSADRTGLGFETVEAWFRSYIRPF